MTTPQQLERRANRLALLNPDSIPALQIGDPVLFAPGFGHSAVGGHITAGPDADGYLQATYAGQTPLCLDHGQDAWINPGDTRTVAWGDGLAGLLLCEPAGPYGNAVADGRVVRPAPAVQIVREREVVEVKPSQPVPRSPEAAARRARAGNTIRTQTQRGTWAPINVDANGERFQRVKLTTSLRPDARDALEQMAAASGLRVCEVLEQLILGAQQPAQPAPAKQQAAGDAITPAELEEAIRRLCQQHGAKWPRGIAGELARRAGVSKQALSGRKSRTLATMAGVG